MKNSRSEKFIKVVRVWPLILLLALWSCGNSEKKNLEDVSTETPSISIHEAAFTGNVKGIRQHIKAKSDLNVKDDFGSTALTIAVTFGKTDVAKALIEGGADIEAVSADGSTPLHTAAFLGRTEIVKSLLEKGANTNTKNSVGSTALESVLAPFDQVKEIYDQVSRDLGPLGLRLNYQKLVEERGVIARMIQNNQ